MNGKWSLRKKENGFVLFVNGQEAVDIFNKKLGFVTTIQPGKDSSQIWIKFTEAKNGRRLSRLNFEAGDLPIDSTSNTSFCKSVRNVICESSNEAEPCPKRRRIHVLNVEDVEEEEDYRDKYIGIYEIPLDNLRCPRADMLARELKAEWVILLRERLLKSSNLQTVLPVLVNPEEVPQKDTFSAENSDRYFYFTLGGNHLRQALQELPQLPDNMKFIQCHVYAGLNTEEAIKIANRHNSKNKHLELTFQDKVRQGRSLFLSSETDLRERLADRLGALEMKEINKDSLSTILSVSKYTNKAYQAAINLIDNYESKYGVLKSIPQKIFRLLQGEVEANQMRVLQMAEESSLDTAVAWYERSIMRQQLQDTFLGHTGLDTWDQAKEAFPAHTTEIETLVGLSKTVAIKQASQIALQAKENIPNITINITFRQGSHVIENEVTNEVINKYKQKILQDYLKKSKPATLLDNES